MSKQLPKSKTDYSLRRRFYSVDGKPLKWIDYGFGMFIGLHTVQNQIKILTKNYPSKKIEIEFILQGELCGFDGEITGKTIIYDKRK